MSDEQINQSNDNRPVTYLPSSIIDNLEKTIQEQEVVENIEETNDTAIIERRVFKQNVETTLDPISKGENKHRPEVFINTPMMPLDIVQRIENISNGEFAKDSDLSKWGKVTDEALRLTGADNGYIDRIGKDGSRWKQYIKYGNINIGPSASRVSFEEGTILTGAQALAATQRHLGIGGNFTVVLPHSGFWMTFKPPLEETFIELHRQFNNIKSEVGRKTYGLGLNASTGLSNELCVRFALTSIVRSSIKDVDNILKIISCHDIENIIWGYVCTLYPNGFNHAQPCIADPTKCTHVEEDLINVRRLFYMDESRFTEEQLKHLSSNTQASMTVDSVIKYQQEYKDKTRKVIKIAEGTDDEVHFTVSVPSAFDYFDSTNKWINSISTKVLEALGADSPYNERNVLINEFFIGGQLRKYAHWVEEINIGGGIIKHKEDIEQTLETMSGSNSVSEEFLSKMREYVGDTKLSIVGIPDFKCSKCKSYQITEDETDHINRSIIGIDVLSNFFTILGQRVQFGRG